MSAWYVGNESLSMITDIIVRYGETGYSGFGFELPRELLDYFVGNEGSLDTHEVFSELRQMNIDALNASYEDSEDMYDELGYTDGCDIWKPRDGVQPWHYQLLKSLDCYLYQCSEGDVPKRKLYKAMDMFCVRLAGFIARNQPEYQESEWK